jgi:hypothetical protein
MLWLWPFTSDQWTNSRLFFMLLRSKIGGGAYCFCPVFLSVLPSSTKSFNFGYNFWMVSTRALIFHMSIPCDKTFLWVSKFFTLVLDLLIENCNLGYVFWLVCTSASIFHMSILCDKTFPWVPKNLTLCRWPWCLNYLLRIFKRLGFLLSEYVDFLFNGSFYGQL